MNKTLTLSYLKDLLTRAENSFHHEECATCENFLGFLTQLEIDGGPEIQAYLTEYKPPREQIHACLGCDPCPPGLLYAEYLQNQGEKP